MSKILAETDLRNVSAGNTEEDYYKQYEALVRSYESGAITFEKLQTEVAKLTTPIYR